MKKDIQSRELNFPLWSEYNDNAQLLYTIKQKISEIAHLYNYKTHDAPILTHVDGYSGCGWGRDGMMRVVTNNEVIALRSDLTGQFNKYMNSIAKKWSKGPRKRLDIGKVFRDEKRVNLGTKREFYQMDLDVADVNLPIEYDIESISCLYEGLKSIFSLLNVHKSFTVQLNNTKIVKALMKSVGIDPEYEYKEKNENKSYLNDFLSLLDMYYKSVNKEAFYAEFRKWLKDKFDVSNENEVNNLVSTFESLMNHKGDIVELIEKDDSLKGEKEAIAELKTVYGWLQNKGVSVKYNPFIARKWYEWTIFETILDNDTEAQWKSICSWGRYNIDKDSNLIGVGWSIGATRLLDFLWNYVSNSETITAYPWTDDIKTKSGTKLIDLMRGNGFSVEQIYADKEKTEKIIMESKDWLLDVLINFSLDPKQLNDRKYVAMIKDIQNFIKKYNKDFFADWAREMDEWNISEEYMNTWSVRSNILLTKELKDKLSSIDGIENIDIKSCDKEVLEKIKDVRVFLCPLYDDDGWISSWDKVEGLYAKKLEKSQDVLEKMDLLGKKVNYIFSDTGLLSDIGDKENEKRILEKNIQNYEKVISKRDQDFSVIKLSSLMNTNDEVVNIKNDYTIEDINVLLGEYSIEYKDGKVRDIIDNLFSQFGSYTKVYVLVHNYLKESKFFYENNPNSMIVLPEKVGSLIDLYDLSKENCTNNSLLIGVRL